MQRIENLPEKLEPFPFALNFDPKQIQAEPGCPQDLPDPHGLSGSPVFRIGASGRSAKDWAPEWAELVGVVTQWRQDHELLVGTKASELLKLAGSFS